MIDELETTLYQERSYELLRQIQQRIGDNGYNAYIGRRKPGVLVELQAATCLPVA